MTLLQRLHHLVLVILVSFACGRGLKGLLVGIAVTHWTSLARLIRGERGEVLQPYIAVSRRLGKSSGWILWPHLLPQFFVGMVLLFPHAILHESAISFLGYGLPPEQPAIGIILSESMKYLSAGMWWLAVCPGLLLMALVLLMDRVGDNLRAILGILPDNAILGGTMTFDGEPLTAERKARLRGGDIALVPQSVA